MSQTCLIFFIPLVELILKVSFCDQEYFQYPVYVLLLYIPSGQIRNLASFHNSVHSWYDSETNPLSPRSLFVFGDILLLLNIIFITITGIEVHELSTNSIKGELNTFLISNEKHDL